MKENSLLTLGNISTSNGTPLDTSYSDVSDGKAKFNVTVSGGPGDQYVNRRALDMDIL